jgi:glyoxylase-like metal-dependent hydrolase (beta-lactamase superfamily II)
MRRILAAAVLAAALVVPASAQPASAVPELPTRADGYYRERLTLAPGVWLLAQPRFQLQPAGNVTVIEQSDGLVLVDAGGSPGDGRRLAAQIRDLSAKPVKAIVITHWHGDHPQGLSELLKAWPNARTIATIATRAHLADPKTMNTPGQPDVQANAAFQRQTMRFVAFAHDNGEKAKDPAEKAGWAAGERLFRQYARDMDGALTLAPQEGFAERLALPDAQRPAEALFLGRANTDGDALLWLPRQKILITGDIVVAPVPFGYGSYPKDWLAVLAKVRAYPFLTLVPGHGLPQHDRAYLDKLTAALTDVRAQVARLADSGASLAEVQRRFDATAEAKSFVGDDPWLRLWFANYWVSPIVASAYKEVRGEPIVQSLGG